MKPELQPFGTFNAMNVQPGPSNLKLSGGETIPYIYQLAINSTVPFIQLLGSGNAQKLLSWNEKIIVPPGEMVTVKNASFHPGDIWISSGWDPGVRPSRVTVPVGLVAAAGTSFTGRFGVDTRRARRAYLEGLDVGPGYDVTITGLARLRSHDVTLAFADSGNPTARYVSIFGIPPATTPGLIPLGEQASVIDPVHALLDLVTFNIDPGAGGMTNISGALKYVLEYN